MGGGDKRQGGGQTQTDTDRHTLMWRHTGRSGLCTGLLVQGLFRTPLRERSLFVFCFRGGVRGMEGRAMCVRVSLCQKRPITVSKETYHCVKRDLLYGKRDLSSEMKIK